MRLSVFIISLFLAACGVDTADDPGGENGGNRYFVSLSGDDGADGSEAAPWRHLQTAVDRLKPGDSLQLLPGVYHETLRLDGDHSGTQQEPVEIIGGTAVVIDGSGTIPSGRHALIELNNAGWIRIRDLELRNFRTATGYEIADTPIGLLIAGGAHDIEIRGLDIHHIENLSSCPLDAGCGTGANGIAVYGDTPAPIRNIRLIGNRVHDNVLASSEAFTLNGNIDGFELIDNEVSDNNNIGFDFIGYESDVCPDCSEEQNRVRNGIVRNNRAYRNTSVGNPAYGDATEGSAGGFYVDGGHHILFENNVSAGNDIGVEIASEHAGKASEYIVIRNLLIHDNLQAGLSLGGYAGSDQGEGGGSAENLWVYNNSLHHNRGWGSEITLAYRVRDAVFANNIFDGAASAAENLSRQANGGYDNLQWKRNLWWGAQAGGGALPVDGQLASDPGFADAAAGDFSLSPGSPAIDAGADLPEIGVWPGDFWRLRYPGGRIPAEAASDAVGNPRVSGDGLDLGALERQ